MKEKNRFSGLLKHLMSVAKVKNYTLARELQYDESYISKWINGNLLPTEKTSDKVLRDISHCMVSSLDDESRATLYSEYQVDEDSDLELAIFDNLEAEFRYVLDLRESTGSEVAPKTTFYPELTLSQFIQKMRHPALRQVKALDVISAVDIFSMDKNYQMSITEVQNASDTSSAYRNYPGVRFALLLDPDSARADLVYNTQFLLNLMTNLSNVNFQLYLSSQTKGKLVFAVRDAYCISGMIMDENHCMSVTATEEQKYCNAIHDRLQSMCNQEALAIRHITMAEMLKGNSYIQYLFSRKQRWLIGHMTEYILPDDLFLELTDELCKTRLELNRELLLQARMFSKSVIENMEVQILFYEQAVTEFSITGTLDFFNTKVTLTPEQRLKCLRYASELYQKNPKISLRLLKTSHLSDSQHMPPLTMFLSDTACNLRIDRGGTQNSLSVVNKLSLCDLLRDFFTELWNSEKYSKGEHDSIGDLFHYAIQLVNIQIQLRS